MRILKGTEKQVAWANDIQKEVLNTLGICLKLTLEEKAGKEDKIEKAKNDYKILKEQFENIDEAKFLIDNLAEITRKNLTEYDKCSILLDFVLRTEGFKSGGAVSAKAIKKLAKRNIENTDKVISTEIPLKNIEFNKYYRNEYDIELKTYYRAIKVAKGAVITIAKDIYKKDVIFFSNGKVENGYSVKDIENIDEIDVVEISK